MTDNNEIIKKNKYPIVGRPRYLQGPQQLQKSIEEYFNNCPDKKILITKDGDRIEIPVPTISGLAYYLGFSSRQSMYDYEHREEYSDVLKRARLLIERKYEQMLETSSPAGAIFALKNMGWQDTQRREITGADGEPFVKKVYITATEERNVNNHIDEIIGSEVMTLPLPVDEGSQDGAK